MHLFDIRKGLPDLPQSIKDIMEEKGQTVEEYVDEVQSRELKTPKEIFEAHRQNKL